MTAEDTDVMVLCLDITSSVYQKCGTFKDFGKLASSLGDSICDALIGLHALTSCDTVSALTGCDTVSALTGRGKLDALKLIKKDSTYWETSANLVSPGKSLNNCLTIYSCLPALPTHLCQTRRGRVQPASTMQRLPPRACFCANYQASIWKCCLQTSERVCMDDR